MKAAKNILIFTDGACKGNPGPGGFGAVIVYPEGKIKELGGRDTATTNNRMEMMAVIRSFERLRGEKLPIWVLTDSTYVIRGITQWIWGWKKRGWRNAEGKEVSNRDLWERLDSAVSEQKRFSPIEWKYVRGHSGTPGNERCDQIAVSFSEGKFIELYNGDLLNYDFAIYDMPDDLSLPEPRSSNQKKKVAHSYLSYVNGSLQRHSTWKECEAVVKGRPGAKFKKSTSAQNEFEIIQSWGANPRDIE